MEELAQVLKQIKEDHMVFKKEFKHVFDKNRDFNKKIKNASTALLDRMKTEGMDTFQLDGFVFEVTNKRTSKHDIEKMAELVDDSEAFQEYMDEVSTDRVSVMTRRTKRQNTGGASVPI